jgi:hypothetical protein
MIWLAQSVYGGGVGGGKRGDKKISFLIYFFIQILSTRKSIFTR